MSNIAGIESIGLAEEQRNDLQLRSIFVEAFDLASPYMDESGNWLSLAHEVMAHDALGQRFPDLEGLRLQATLTTIASVQASGRVPTP